MAQAAPPPYDFFLMSLSPADQRAYGANIWKVYAFQFFMNFQFWHSIWVLYLTDLRKFSMTQVTLLDVPFWLLIVVAEVPSGAFADRFGRRTSLVMASACFTLAILIFGLTGNYIVILFSYSLWALSLTFMSGADNALLYDSLKLLGREGEFAKVGGRLAAVMAGGALGGTLLGAPMAAWMDSLSLPIVLSSVMVVASLVCALSMKEPPLYAGETVRYVDLFRDARDIIWTQPAVRSFMVLATVIAVASFAPAVFFEQPFLRDHGVKVEYFGLALAPNLMLGVLTALVAYKVVGLTGPRAVYLWITGALLMSIGVLSAVNSVWAFAAFPVMVGMRNMLQPLAGDYLNRRIPSSHRATVLSIRQLLFSLWVAPMEPILGLVFDHVSLMAVYRVSALALLAIGPPVYLWWLRHDRAAGEPAMEPEGSLLPAASLAAASADQGEG